MMMIEGVWARDDVMVGWGKKEFFASIAVYYMTKIARLCSTIPWKNKKNNKLINNNENPVPFHVWNDQAKLLV